MFDLRDDGTIGIDFEITPETEGDPTTRTVVVKAPPTFGAYKRIRAEVDAINARRDEIAKAATSTEGVTVAQMQAQVNAATEDGVAAWWKFVMIGDESFKGLADSPPPDVDEWPVYLVSNESIPAALSHWKSVPLAHGGKLVPKTS